MRKIVIAFDGYASTGKSSLAKLLSSHLNYIYVNSGSMYRAITYYAIRNKLIPLTKKNINSLIGLLSKIQLDYKINKSTGFSDIYLNGSNLESEIKSLEVSNYVSSVAEIPKIRKHVVEIQKSFQHKGGLVMDGRDIGSVVFPNADLKLFLTASDHIRAKRRFDELINEKWFRKADIILFLNKNDLFEILVRKGISLNHAFHSSKKWNGIYYILSN
jgi:cytidylate kinase